MNMVQTTRTYATYDNAVKALTKALGSTPLDSTRWLVAATSDGRFAPVLVGVEYIRYAVSGNVTVVG